jgi:hypothetical protein
MDPSDPKAIEQTASQPEQPEKPAQQTKQPETPMQELQEIEQEIGKRFRDHKLFFPLILIIIIFFTWAIIALLFPKNNSNNSRNTGPTATPASQSDHVKKAAQPTPSANKDQTFVYGTWTSQSSVIRAIDLASNNIVTVATLPLTIKKVSVLSKNSLLYIDQTDNYDHGTRISIYNTQQKQITTNIPAANGYGIDDYVLSPNKRYLAMWEVQFSPDTHTLQNGQSRIYTVDLTRPTIVNLVYDESVVKPIGNYIATLPVHYPVAVLSDGTVFTDQFLPNDPNGGTGWAYGMSTVDFDGTNKQDITSMPNGTYGSKPSLSPDGKFLLFAGYDGSHGDGTKIIHGYRQALLTPNTVELLDTETLKRYPLPNLPNSNTYSDVQWDKQIGNVIISILSQDSTQMGMYKYDLGSLQKDQIQLPSVNGTQYGYIAQLTDKKTLIGIQSTEPSNLGNLGETYSYAYTQLASFDENNKLSYISVEDPFIQYITILPGNYFNNVLGASTKAQTTPQPSVSYSVLQGSDTTPPQNYAFFLKTTLAGIRIQGKSNPPNVAEDVSCQNLGNARCGALGLTPKSTGYIICQNIEKANNRTANACY